MTQRLWSIIAFLFWAFTLTACSPDPTDPCPDPNASRIPPVIGGAAEPTILPDPAGGYRMYYTFGPGVGLATSHDGRNWTLHPNPVLTGGLRNNILYHQGTYYLYYVVNPGGPNPLRVATSSDGLTFTKHDTPVLTPNLPWAVGIANTFA